MDPERWSKVKEVFATALSLSGKNRLSFLSKLDEDIRTEVLSLLASYEEDGDALEQVLLTNGAGILRKAIEETVGYEQIGPYRILGEIGHGGMGAVYRAVRTDTEAEPYALKIIRPGLNQALLVRRFRQELRILKELRHPYIAAVLDSGTTEHDQPFFVMDLIQGTPIDEYCDLNMLSLRERLALFLKICEAVQAAHSIGVVHRDLKPSNVLVTADGTPKLLDFGIAKVVNPELAGQTIDLTATVHRLMTPEYASPEQARGELATPASDVYSLGVLLYELLTGERPYRVTRETPEAILQAICEQQPAKPSSRFGRFATTGTAGPARISAEVISRKRSTTPKLLKRRLRGKLDNIVLKALTKAPADRYQSARELADDIVRYLERRPITARGERLATRLRILLPRKVPLAAAGGAIVAVLLIAVVLWRWQRSDNRVLSQPSKLRRSVAVLGFKDLRASNDTAWLSTALSEMLSTELAAGESLRIISGEDVAHAKADLALVDRASYRPATLKRIRAELGSDLVVAGSYLDSGKPGDGEIRLDIALQDASSGETLATVSEQGDEAHLFELIARVGTDLRVRLGIGETSPQELEAVRASISTSPEVARLYSEGLDRLRIYDYREARRLLERAVQLDPKYPLAHAALAEVWSDLGFDQRAQREAKEAFAASKGMLREGRLWVEGQFRMTAHEQEKAVQIYQTLLRISPDDLDYGLRLAAAEITAGKPNDSLAVVQKLRKLPEPMRSDPRLDLAEAEGAESTAQYRRAYDLAHQAAEKARRLGARLLLSRATLLEARALAQLGNYDEAFAMTAEARRLSNAVGDTRGAAIATRVLGRMFLDKTDLADASETFADAFRLFSSIGDEAGVALILRDRSALQSVAGNPEAALRLDREALAKARELGDVNLIAHCLNSLGVSLHLKGDLNAAVEPLQECIHLARTTGNRSALLFGTGSLGEVRFDQGEMASAKTLLEESIQIGEASGETRGSAYAQLYLARVLALEGRQREAQDNVAQSLKIWKQRGDGSMIAYSELVGIEIALIGGQVPNGEKTLEKAAAVFEAKKNHSFELQANTILLRLLLAKGKQVEAKQAVAKLNHELGSHRNFGFELDAQLVIAQALSSGGHTSESESKIQAIIATAKRHGYGRGCLEAEAILARVQIQKGNTKRGEDLLSSVRSEAAQKNMPSVVNIADSRL